MAEIRSAHMDLLHDQGWFSHLDYHLARTLARVFDQASPLCVLSCALVSRALSKGHICLDLNQVANTVISIDPDGPGVLTLPELTAWRSALEACEFVATDEDTDPEGQAIIPAQYPLMLDKDNNLYLSKYFDFQQRLADQVRLRVQPRDSSGAPDSEFISDGITPYFTDQDPEHTAAQKQAVEKALVSDFLLISGGPGTGKTYVTRIIQALWEKWLNTCDRPRPRVLNLAPTGKAAARLQNGITIHAALKPRKDGPGFVHGKDFPLAADVVIVDESSMIDMALMTRLMEAVPLTAKLIFLGDKNQLSPVQAGAVFTDLCGVEAFLPFRVELVHNFRSRGKSGIEALATAVNENDKAALVQVLTGKAYPDIDFWDSGNKPVDPAVLRKIVRKEYAGLGSARTPEQALERMDDFRILCAHNTGLTGTLQVNHLCGKLLPSMGEIAINTGLFKQLVMVTRNDYSRQLFNGDTGVVFDSRSGGPGESPGESLADGPPGARVYFRTDGGGIRACRPADLPAHEPGFAVTIHKSQGSEFDTVLILIPDKLSPVVTRQLLYTGITRARTRAIIAGSLAVICEAMDAPLERRSNLAALLTRQMNE